MSFHTTTGLIPVIAALLGNIFVTTIKFIASFVSGSSAMFSESIHGFADTANQFFLLIGLQRSKKLPDEEFVYGYGNERFFWALISACAIFFLGSGITIYKGINSLLHPTLLDFKPILGIILLISLIVESYTFFLAVKELKKQLPDLSFFERLKNGDPSTLAVFYEDGLAVVGIFIASTSIILTKITANPVWDATGSIIIGVCLGIIAIILIAKNRTYLLGKTIPDHLEENIIKALEADPGIEKVLDFKSRVLDIGIYRIKCEIEFNGYVLFKEIYNKEDLREQYEEVKDDYEEFKKFCVDYADRIPRLVGKKIDEIETKLKKENPGIKYIDIEIN